MAKNSAMAKGKAAARKLKAVVNGIMALNLFTDGELSAILEDDTFSDSLNILEERVTRLSNSYDFRQSWTVKHNIDDENIGHDTDANYSGDAKNGQNNKESSETATTNDKENEFKSLLVASLAMERIKSSEKDHERWLEKVQSFNYKLLQKDKSTETIHTTNNKWRYLTEKILAKHPRSHILDFLLEVAADGGEFETFNNDDYDENMSLKRCGFSSHTLSTAGSSGTLTSLDDSTRSNFSRLPQPFSKASIFTVWRPTSTDAIRKMICKEAVGKGVDIKGKSSKKGKLSGFVPFLQINKNHHKGKIKFFNDDHGTQDGQVVRIFFTTQNARGRVVKKMMRQHCRLGVENVMESVTHIDDYRNKGRFGLEIPVKLFWVTFILMQDITCEKGSTYDRGRPSSPFYQDMNLDTICSNSAFVHTVLGNGLNVSKKEEGRSCVAYGNDDEEEKYRDQYRDHRRSHEQINRDFDANVADEDDDDSLDLGAPRPVLLQNASETEDPMNPFELLLAYEDDILGTVLPVVSDFDCFLIGTKRVRYKHPMEPNQLEIIKWNIQQIESILQGIYLTQTEREPPEDDDEPSRRPSIRLSNADNLSFSWLDHWIKYYKMDKERILELGGRNFGYGDPKSRKIIKAAIKRMRLTSGAMRHGPECFNYLMPQDLDDEFVIISESRQQSFASLSSLNGDTGGANTSRNGSNRDDDYFYQTVNREQLQFFLETKILEGYTFPLHPKWILCDCDSSGRNKWKELYDLLLSSTNENTIDSMNVWFPPDSGIREDIQRIHNKYPNGFP